MKLSDFLSPERVLANIEAQNKRDALKEISEFVSTVEKDDVLTAKRLFNAILDREELGSTGIGDGVAIPHAKIHGLKNLCACFARSQDGVDFKAIDSEPVRLIFMLLVPENSAGIHLKALARISRVLKERDFREQLIAAKDSQELYDAFIRQDTQN
jgi:PTS system nitrogen regulatory IIA component